MRKRLLIKNNQLLEEKLLEADYVIKELKEEIALLNDKIKVLEAENLKLSEEKNSYASQVQEQPEIAEEINTQETANEVSSDETVSSGFQIDTEVLDIKENDTDNLNDFAVSVVAKIILECTKADMTVAASNLDSKDDDRNVILGSAEAAKARIFEYLNENKDNEFIKSKIEAELSNYLTCIQNILIKYN